MEVFNGTSLWNGLHIGMNHHEVITHVVNGGSAYHNHIVMPVGLYSQCTSCLLTHPLHTHPLVVVLRMVSHPVNS